MRLALLSDIHGNLAALEAVAQDLATQGVDRVVNLGDSLSGPLLPRETAAFLMAQDWLHLAGNHERQLLEPMPISPSDAYARSRLTARELAWVAGLEPSRSLDGDVFLCHGTPACDHEHLLATVEPGGLRQADPMEVDRRLEGVGAALVACGHTHLPRWMRGALGRVVVNPGSVGLQAYVDADPYPYSVENGCPEARYALAEGRDGVWGVELRSVPYDAEPMALLARARDFPRWETALRTGCLPKDT